MKWIFSILLISLHSFAAGFRVLTSSYLRVKKIIFPALFFLFFVLSFSSPQKEGPALSKNHKWQLLDYAKDTVYGTSVNRAYKELLKNKKSHPVIVAVIDCGVEITHEDLQGHIWTNKNEIAGNGIDDDKNGYIDDVHGWNFLGGKDGRMMDVASSKVDREYTRLLPVYGNIKDTSRVHNKKEYKYFINIKAKHLQDSVRRSPSEISKMKYIVAKAANADSILKKETGEKSINLKDVESFQPKDSVSNAAKKFLLYGYNYGPLLPNGKSLTVEDLIWMGRLFLFRAEHQMDEKYKKDPNALRKEIVGDNPFDIHDSHYGNNIVGDKYAFHGTHCSGIITADRNNEIGIDGIADNVLIMPIRAVIPLGFGDARDKDIALAIRYAVDNGAKIISMSFGNDLSPQKQWVDEAVKYAEKKGVLLVHAAGNASRDIDTTAFYPNAEFLDSSGRAKNMITVGASSMDTGYALPASFSDYGQKEVDVFAPGVHIYSLWTGNSYNSISGTSMAAPVVTGIAALILEYYPELTAEQVKDIIMKSVTQLKGKLVYKPGTKQKVKFGTLCVSGGIVNAYNALKLADKIASN